MSKPAHHSFLCALKTAIIKKFLLRASNLVPLTWYNFYFFTNFISFL
jgi:hypothetical protein